MKKVLIDAHTHTVASGHAYSSLQEMAKAAADMGLEVLGITEHGPSVPGTCPTLYFKNMFVVHRQMYGIRLLMGCEINILDTKGSLDLTDEQIDWLDIAIAGVHAAWYQAGTKEENTEGMIRVIKNPKIHIISHPGPLQEVRGSYHSRQRCPHLIPDCRLRASLSASCRDRLPRRTDYELLA